MNKDHLTVPTLAATGDKMGFGSDRRLQPRAPYDCPVRWRLEREKRVDGMEHVGWARDAGSTGAGFTLRATTPPAVGEAMRVVFQLNNCYDWLVAQRAVVRWTRQIRDGVWNVGVEFRAHPADLPS